MGFSSADLCIGQKQIHYERVGAFSVSALNKDIAEHKRETKNVVGCSIEI